MTSLAALVDATARRLSARPERRSQSVSPDKRPLNPSRLPIAPADALRIAIVVTTAGLLESGVWTAFGHPRLFGCTALLVGGYPIVEEAVGNVLERRMTMELSMTIALVAALVIGEVVTALVIAAFVLV